MATPINPRYVEGNIWRYGPTADGTANDTPAFAAMIGSGAPNLIVENGTFSIAGTHVIAADRTRLSMRNAVLKVRDETGAGYGMIKVTGNDCHVDVVIDHNGLGIGGVGVTGDRNYVKAIGSNFVGSASSGPAESVVKNEGDGNTIWAEGYSLGHGTASGAVPRLVTCQGGGSGTKIEMLKGRDVYDGLVVGEHSDVTVVATDIDGCSDNPFYVLGRSHRLRVLGGRCRNFGEIAFKGNDHEISNMSFEDFLICTIENVNRLAFRNCKFRHSDATRAGSVIATRATNTASTDITLENCHAEINVKNGGLAHLSAGTVSGFKVTGGKYQLTWTDLTSAKARIVTHSNAATSLVYQGVTIQLDDAKTTPLTAANILDWDIPTLSAMSIWDRCTVINNTAAMVRVGSGGGIIQPNMQVRDDGLLRGDPGSSVQSLASAVKGVRWSTAAPTAGTWAVGDIVFNSSPSLGRPRSWVCTKAGTPGTWTAAGQSGLRSGSRSPVGAVVPRTIGEIYVRTSGPTLWVSVGHTKADWLQLG
jgi:hypothetical protein